MLRNRRSSAKPAAPADTHGVVYASGREDHDITCPRATDRHGNAVRFNPLAREGCPADFEPHTLFTPNVRHRTGGKGVICCKEVRFDTDGTVASEAIADAKAMRDFFAKINSDWSAMSSFMLAHRRSVYTYIQGNQEVYNKLISQVMETGTLIQLEIDRCQTLNPIENKVDRADAVIRGCGNGQKIVETAKKEYLPLVARLIAFLNMAVSGYDVKYYRDRIATVYAEYDEDWSFLDTAKWIGRRVGVRVSKWFANFLAWVKTNAAVSAGRLIFLYIPTAIITVSTAPGMITALMAKDHKLAKTFAYVRNFCLILKTPALAYVTAEVMFEWLKVWMDGEWTPVSDMLDGLARLVPFLGPKVKIMHMAAGATTKAASAVGAGAKAFASKINTALEKQAGNTTRAIVAALCMLLMTAIQSGILSGLQGFCKVGAKIAEAGAEFTGDTVGTISSLMSVATTLGGHGIGLVTGAAAAASGKLDKEVEESILELEKQFYGVPAAPATPEAPEAQTYWQMIFGDSKAELVKAKANALQAGKTAAKTLDGVHGAVGTGANIVGKGLEGSMKTVGDTADWLTQTMVEYEALLVWLVTIVSNVAILIGLVYMMQMPEDDSLDELDERVGVDAPLGTAFDTYGRITPKPDPRQIMSRCQKVHGRSVKDCEVDVIYYSSSACDLLTDDHVADFSTNASVRICKGDRPRVTPKKPSWARKTGLQIGGKSMTDLIPAPEYKPPAAEVPPAAEPAKPRRPSGRAAAAPPAYEESLDAVYRRLEKASSKRSLQNRHLDPSAPTAPTMFAGLVKYTSGVDDIFDGYAHVVGSTPLLVRYTVAQEVTGKNLANFLRASNLTPRSLLQAQNGVMTGPLTGGIASLITTRMSVVPIILDDNNDPLVFPASLAGATKFAILDMAGHPLVRRVGGGALSGVYTKDQVPADILAAFFEGVAAESQYAL